MAGLSGLMSDLHGLCGLVRTAAAWTVWTVWSVLQTVLRGIRKKAKGRCRVVEARPSPMDGGFKYNLSPLWTARFGLNYQRQQCGQWLAVDR